VPLEFALTNKWEDCKRICPRPAVVLDCGANIGQTARNLRQAYPEATIYCFEPVQDICDQLVRASAALNIIPVQSAVSDRNGWADINLTASSESHSLLGQLEGFNPLAEHLQVIGSERVRMVRLDDWCPEVDIDPASVGILKMDVQGAELMALRGAENMLQTVRAVLLEVAFVPFYRNCPLFEQIEAFMRGHGFARRALYASVRPDIWGDALYAKVD
jgi:FkbM family methyltransferase